MTAIRVSNVYKIFGPTMTHARVIDMLRHGASKADVLADNGCNVGLNNINLKIEAGQIFVIMGLSGSGKSTLVRHFNRLIDLRAENIAYANSFMLMFYISLSAIAFIWLMKKQ